MGAYTIIDDSTLTTIANAIRGKEGSTELILLRDMPSRISSLNSETPLALKDLIERNGTPIKLIDNTLETLPAVVFSKNRDIVEVTLNACKQILVKTFNYCNNLEVLRLPVCEQIGEAGATGVTSCFYLCDKLSDIYLGCNVMCVLNCGGPPATTTIHVRDNLVDEYKNDSAWSAYADKIVGYNPEQEVG